MVERYRSEVLSWHSTMDYLSYLKDNPGAGSALERALHSKVDVSHLGDESSKGKRGEPGKRVGLPKAEKNGQDKRKVSSAGKRLKTI